MNERELADKFRKLGARDPDAWARSQIEEGIPQLARYVFLMEAWKLVIRENDRTWASELLEMGPDEPGSAANPAIKRLLNSGCSQADLTLIVRTMQWKVLSGLCRLLDDPGLADSGVADIEWQLFQLDESDRPIIAICGLLESVLETEPSGLEMRTLLGDLD